MVASSASLLLLLIHRLLCISAHDFLSPGASLSEDNVLYSPDGDFACGLYKISPNSCTFSIWFTNSADKTVVWSANPLHPVYTQGSKMELKSDGSMVLTDNSGQIVWTNNVSSSNGEQVQAQLLNTGNLIVKGKAYVCTRLCLPVRVLQVMTSLIQVIRAKAAAQESISPHIGSTGTMYLKLPMEEALEKLQLSERSIPQSRPFGPKYGPDCNANKNLDEHKSGQNESKYLYFYGFLSAIFLAEVTFIVFGWFILRREDKLARGISEVGYEMVTNHFRRYAYRELMIATRKFQGEIGRGASGIVYKGILKDMRAVAVKKLLDINQGEEEFKHELSVIGRIYHMNLVRVWGFCSDDPHRMLISEYVENGSLDKILFGDKGSQALLGWKQRFNIALGVAKGLAYLHHECLEWVIHCDVKPENILLDENMEPKIADFGLAKLLNRGGSKLNVSRIQGTRDYLAPEWVSSLPITAKVDVYSFGVVLLELLKGARVSDLETNEDEEVEMVLGRIIRTLAESLKSDGDGQSWIVEFIDTRLNGRFNDLQARAMMKLAVSCLEEDRGRRPTMESVVEVLVSVDEASSTI
ncbi:putative receptor protein kinase ZmPK1 [Oryza glaberrima]|uniref:putative receptor protein kinase ZmPK1 n=1 Tax=Oryza glaberrima TaxID=4538 RepID=UPI00224BF799|nr:putative receptor protein kinase ZmPK1 [Oryza glaberrima]